MPTREQAEFARQVVNAARIRLRGRMVIDYVPADHHAIYPKACMGGWGSTGLNIAPDGAVLPCHAAATLPGLVPRPRVVRPVQARERVPERGPPQRVLPAWSKQRRARRRSRAPSSKSVGVWSWGSPEL